MARKFIVQRKIHRASSQLGVFEMLSKGSGDFSDKNKVAYFDYLQELSVEDRAQLFRYRADRERALALAWERLDFDPDEIAQKFGVDCWREFKQQTYCWINGHNVNTAKMVSLLTDGHGQQYNEGRRLKAQLDKLLNDQLESDFFTITD
jgi:hypothetical protein